MNYYGAYVNEPSHRHVLCHRITVQEYERTLPNGKTIKVRGYSRQGDAAVDQARANRNTYYSNVRNRYVQRGNENFRNAGASARNAVSSQRMNAGSRQDDARYAARYAGRGISNYANAGRVAARQVYENARDWASDAAETASASIQTFMEEVRYGAAYAGAAASEAAKKIAARAKKAYDAGKSFIEKLFGKVKEIAGNVGKAVSGAYNSARQTVTGTYNNVRNRVNQEVTNYQMRRNKRQI